MERAVIVNSLRTPVGGFGRSSKSVSAVEPGVIAAKETLNAFSCRRN